MSNVTKFILIVLTIIGLYNVLFDDSNSVEGFHSYYYGNGYFKRYCPACGNKSRYSCSNCTNCGYCITADRRGSCVPGDEYGPYFRSDCASYEYGREFGYPTSLRVRSRFPWYNRWRSRWFW